MTPQEEKHMQEVFERSGLDGVVGQLRKLYREHERDHASINYDDEVVRIMKRVSGVLIRKAKAGESSYAYIPPESRIRVLSDHTLNEKFIVMCALMGLRYVHRTGLVFFDDNNELEKEKE